MKRTDRELRIFKKLVVDFMSTRRSKNSDRGRLCGDDIVDIIDEVLASRKNARRRRVFGTQGATGTQG